MRTALLLLALTATAYAQWDIQTSNTTASLRGIHALGNGVAWASGTEGTVLHTTDNGAHWQRCTTPPGAEKLDFRGIQAFDATTAIVMSSGKGDLSRLYKTTDACQTWKLVFTNPDKDGFWDAIQIDIRKPARSTDDWKDRRYGVLVGDPVNRILSIWETHDAGSTWTRWNKDDPKHHPKTRDNETLFAASNQAAVIPGNNGAFAFVTGGRKSELCMDTLHNPFDAGLWSTIGCRSLGFPGGESAGAFAVAARSAGPLYRSEYHDLMVVGGDYSRPEASGDVIFYPGIPRLILGYRGGIAATTQPHGYRSAVAYDAPTKTWITVGPNGTDISTDDGRNWRALKPLPGQPDDADQHWNALSLPFVVGPHGRIGILNPGALPAPEKRDAKSAK